MKARLLLLLSSLFLASGASAGTAVKAVMEGIWASSNTVFISTPTQKVEFGNGGIKFADGTTQTTAATYVSTSNYVNEFTASVTRTGYGVCDSTVSFTPSSCSKAAEITIGLNFSDANGNRTGCANVLMNGAFISPFTTSKGMACEERITAASSNNGLFHKTIFVSGIPCSGQVAFCLTLKTDAGTLTFPGTFGGDEINQWGVRLIP